MLLQSCDFSTQHWFKLTGVSPSRAILSCSFSSSHHSSLPMSSPRRMRAARARPHQVTAKLAGVRCSPFILTQHVPTPYRQEAPSPRATEVKLLNQVVLIACLGA